MDEPIRIRAVARADRAAVQALIFAVLDEFGLTPDPLGVDADLRQIPDVYVARGGDFFVLQRDGQAPGGTLALWPIDGRRIELRKMYFSPALRGVGAGKAALDFAIRRARSQRYTRMELETAGVLRAALGLYRSFGFRDLKDTPSIPRCEYKLALDLAAYRTPAGLVALEECL